MFELNIEITEEQLSEPYQHIHHADIIRFLEQARVSYLESITFPLEFFFAQDLLLVISAIQIQYKREVTLGLFKVTCDEIFVDGKKILIQQRIVNSKGKNCVVASVESQTLSRRQGRAVVPPEEFLRAIGS